MIPLSLCILRSVQPLCGIALFDIHLIPHWLYGTVVVLVLQTFKEMAGLQTIHQIAEIINTLFCHFYLSIKSEEATGWRKNTTFTQFSKF